MIVLKTRCGKPIRNENIPLVNRVAQRIVHDPNITGVDETVPCERAAKETRSDCLMNTPGMPRGMSQGDTSHHVANAPVIGEATDLPKPAPGISCFDRYISPGMRAA